MAIVAMKQITVCGLKHQQADILAYLQRCGCVQPAPIAPEAASISQTGAAQKRAFYDKGAAEAKAALEVLGTYGVKSAPPLSMLAGRETLSQEACNAYMQKNEETIALIARILTLGKAIQDRKAENQRLTAQIAALEPWLPLAVPTSFEGTKTTEALIGTLPGPLTREAVMAILAEKLPHFETYELDIVFTHSDATGIFLLCRKEERRAAEDALRAAGFMRVANPSTHIPEIKKSRLQSRIQKNEESNEADIKKLQSLAEKTDQMRFYIDYCTMRSEEYAVTEALLQSRYAFFLTGYLPANEAPEIEQQLQKRFGAAVEIAEPDPEADVPVLLKNNAFTTPVESVVEAYSMPAKGELDPSVVMSLFYYLLFGLMLSDAGYGVLIVLACSICLTKFKNMESSMKNTLKMFLYCGISTMFWGFLQGSFFGDVVGVVASTFFGSNVALGPLWFAPLDDPMRMLLFALLLGIIHLFCGLAMNMAQHFKNKEYREIFYDGIFWYLLIGGLVLLLTTSSMFADVAGFQLALPPVGMTILKGAILAGALGIILTSGRDSKNWVVRILRGLYGLYGATGYLSDILSYSRLLALGLATGVIGTVINKMAGMAAEPLGGFGIIVFVIIFLLGHAINLGINLLGAYVHTNRLQFVEFFGKFYNGGGRKFEPFAAHTKYYKLSKEDN